MANLKSDKLFTGSIPEIYEKYLVPLIFEHYARDLANRVSEKPVVPHRDAQPGEEEHRHEQPNLDRSQAKPPDVDRGCDHRDQQRKDQKKGGLPVDAGDTEGCFGAAVVNHLGSKVGIRRHSVQKNSGSTTQWSSLPQIHLRRPAVTHSLPGFSWQPLGR